MFLRNNIIIMWIMMNNTTTISNTPGSGYLRYSRWWLPQILQVVTTSDTPGSDYLIEST
jgi:hypothetical protein